MIPRVCLFSLCISLLFLGSLPAQIATESVYYSNDTLPLAGLLLLPQSANPLPAAIIAQGSGPSDRSNQWARAIAEVIAGQGFAVLLTDKRGSGESGGDWRTAGFAELADDILAAYDYLRQRNDIDTNRIGLVGLSQGGWVAPVAAARQPKVAFVINISGATTSFAEQSFTEMANTVRQTGLGDTAVAHVLAINRAAGRYAQTGDWEPYARLRTEGLDKPWGRIAAGFPAAPDAAIWTFIRKVIDFSPIPYWMLIESPVLVVYGEADNEDNVPVGESVHRLRFAYDSIGKTNYDIEVIPGANHGLIYMTRIGLGLSQTNSVSICRTRRCLGSPNIFDVGIDTEKQQLMGAFVDLLEAWLQQLWD